MKRGPNFQNGLESSPPSAPGLGRGRQPECDHEYAGTDA